MGKILIIGCGGVATVAAHKICQNKDTFTDIKIASRTKSKCDALAEILNNRYGTNVTTAAVDADSVPPVGRSDERIQTRYGSQLGFALSGSDHHGCLS